MNLRHSLSLLLLAFVATTLNGCSGSLGQRSNRDFQTRSMVKATGLSSVSPSVAGIPDASIVRQIPKEIVLVGFPLEPEASRQQIQEAILRRGGKVLVRLHSPERDEFDSSRWIPGSDKTVAFYTQTGELIGLAISWPMEDSQGGRAFVRQLHVKLTKEFGPTTRDDRGQWGWPILHLWETAPIHAAIIGEGKDAPVVLAMFMLPKRLPALTNEPDDKTSGLLLSHR